MHRDDNSFRPHLGIRLLWLLASPLFSLCVPAVAHAAQDIDTLTQTYPAGLWSNSDTIWLSDFGSGNLLAFGFDGLRRSNHDISNLAGSNPMGLWSDGNIIWVADFFGGGVHAYALAGGARMSSRDITLDDDNQWPTGIWSDGESLWVADYYADRAYAYALSDGVREAAKDIVFGDSGPRRTALWSDGSTMWVANWTGGEVLAYRMSDGARQSDLDVDVSARGNDGPMGLWSDGANIWVTDTSDKKAYVYSLPGAADEDTQQPSIDPPVASIEAGTTTVAEGAETTFTVMLDAAQAETLTVSLIVSESGSMLSGMAPASVEITAGQTSATVTVATTDDDVEETSSTVTAAISSGAGYSVSSTAGSASVTVTDNDIATLVDIATMAVAISRTQIEEGQNATVSVGITSGNSFAQDQTIALTVSGSASTDDYTLTPLTLGSGSVLASATLTIINDAVDEPEETLNITASHAGSEIGEVTVTVHHSDPATAPLAKSNPIRARIGTADVTVAAEDFVRAPQTYDSTNTSPTNAAYARIQYLIPVPGSDRLAFNDLRGIIYLTDSEGATPTSYLDLRTRNVDFDHSYPNESGLLGIAFHPEFAQAGEPGYGKFYTAYTATNGGGVADYLDNISSHESVVREWTATDPFADIFAGSSREMLRIGQHLHTLDIGTLAFNASAAPGSVDYGNLYIAMGDGGGINDPNHHGQNLATPLGTILRIDPLGGDGDREYGIPADNPFVGIPGVVPEIWAYGLRHPQHFSFDSTGRMFINDIGEDQVEEINIGRAGANYGWRLRQGKFATAFSVDSDETESVFELPGSDTVFDYPIAQYDHRPEGRAISGGFLYEGDAIPALQGKYVFSDLVKGRLFFFDLDDPVNIKELKVTFAGVERKIIDVANIVDTYRPWGSNPRRADLRLGVDHDGELYILTKADGWIRRLKAPEETAVTTTPEASITAGASPVAEGEVATFTVTLDAAPTESMTVSLSVSETGTMLSGAAPVQVEIAAGDTSATVTLATEDDSLDETNSTVTVALSSGTGYTVSSSGGSASVTVTDNDEPLSDDATLSSLSLSDVDIGAFSAGDTNYSATVANSVTSTTVTAAANDDGASVEIADGNGGTSGTPATVTLAEGANAITVTVAAEDGQSTQLYTVTVTRMKLPEASIIAGAGPVAEGETATFTVTLDAAPTESMTVSLSVSETGAMLSGAAPVQVEIAAGDTSATVTLATEDDSLDETNSTVTVALSSGTGYTVSSSGGSASVTVTDNDEPPSDDATLSSLSLSDVDIGAFSAGDTNYSATVANSVTSTTVTAAVNDDGASVEIADGNGGTSGTPATVTLAEGSNTITVTVTAEDGQSTQLYTVTVTRMKPPLTGAFENMPETHDGSLEFTFHVRFSDNIEHDNGVLGNQVFTVTGGALTSTERLEGGSASAYWKFKVRPDGEGDVEMVLPVPGNCAATGAICTSDGRKLSTRLEATVGYAVTDDVSADATLKSLALSGVNFGTFSSGTTAYTATVAHDLEQTTVTAEANVSDASLVLADSNGSTTGTSRTVLLLEGDNEITATVTAADGETSLTYSVIVTRPEPPLIATFENMPETHDGSASFKFNVRFNYSLRNSYKVLRDHAFTVTGGGVTRARRVDGSSSFWEIEVEPDGNSDVKIVLEPQRRCARGPCASNNRQLSNQLEATVQGPDSVNTSAVTVAPGAFVNHSDRSIDLDVNAIPAGMWSDGEDLWVISNWQEGEIRVFSTADGTPNPELGFNIRGGNGYPAALWSDGATLWVADFLGGVLAYRRADGARLPVEDFDENVMFAAGNIAPSGLWSEDGIIWVADFLASRIFAYRLSDKSRLVGRDLVLNGSYRQPVRPFGLWSDGESLLTKDWKGGHVLGFSLHDGTRLPTHDMYAPLPPAEFGNHHGLTFDGETLWVLDDLTKLIHAVPR